MGADWRIIKSDLCLYFQIHIDNGHAAASLGNIDIIVVCPDFSGLVQVILQIGKELAIFVEHMDSVPFAIADP